jgi:hypothetical protein
MPAEKRTSCLELCFKLQQDISPVVRASACRALGVFVAYPSFRAVSQLLVTGNLTWYSSLLQDHELLLNVGQTLLPLSTNMDLAIRIRSTWALANLFGALSGLDSQLQEDESDNTGDRNATNIEVPTLATVLSDAVASSFLKSAINAANDNEKVCISFFLNVASTNLGYSVPT